MPRNRMLMCLAGVVLLVGALPGCASDGDGSPAAPTAPTAPSEAPTVLTITPSGLRYVDSISADARWLVGSKPREEGSGTPKPEIRLDRVTGEQTVLCDWADEDLGYCSLAEQGGMIAESPNVLLELVDDNAVRGWFPSGGVYLTDTSSGERTRVDTDSAGVPLAPAWTAQPCGGQCDYHQVPRLHISTDAVSGDGRVAAFCANYDEPKEPILYVKDLVSGQLTRTTVRCGVTRFGPEDDDDEFNDEGMSYPQISADGTVVHVSGDQSTGGEYGRVGWQSDTLYLIGSGEARKVGGSGAMTRDGSTLFLRKGEQPEIPDADVVVDYVAYDVASGQATALPWMRDFLARPNRPAPVLDTVAQASSDGRLVLSATAIRDVRTGAEVDIASLLRDHGFTPTEEWGPMRISGDGSTIVADVITGDPLAESGNSVVLITGWSEAGTAGSGAGGG